MDKWEHKRLIVAPWNEVEISNKMGEDGWELCACWFFYLYFKRRISN